MRSSSAAKVKQIIELMNSLHVRNEVRERLDMNTGFIERFVFWIDDEQYPSPAPTGATGPTAEAPTGASEPAQQEVAPTGAPGPQEDLAGATGESGTTA